MLNKYAGEAFDTVVKKEGLVVVDFFATWCGPCKMLMPILEEVSNEVTDVTFVKVDIDEYRPLAVASSVRSVPTLVIFKDGQEVARQAGFQPKDNLLKWIESSR